MIKLMDERKKWKRVNTEVGKKMYRAQQIKEVN